MIGGSVLILPNSVAGPVLLEFIFQLFGVVFLDKEGVKAVALVLGTPGQEIFDESGVEDVSSLHSPTLAEVRTVDFVFLDLGGLFGL